MTRPSFVELLQARMAERKAVCVGLDTSFKMLPQIPSLMCEEHGITEFNRKIVNATKDLVLAYKPNAAFYEARGDEGWRNLKRTVDAINELAPDVPVILDAKRGDIGSTNDGYVTAIFDWLGIDAVTVHPYLGEESLAPFLARKDKGVIVLCRTSNPGAGEFQDLQVDGRPLYQHVARAVADKWNKNNNCCLVVGATFPTELGLVREIVGEMPILIPGIGAQGGDVEATVKAGKNSTGNGMIINSSRGIIYASKGEDFAEAARRETLKLHELINQYR